MASWLSPTISNLYTDIISLFKQRDDDSAKMFDGTGSDLPVGTVRWDSGTSKWDKLDIDGVTWNALTGTYQINVATVGGKAASAFVLTTSYTAADVLNKLKTVDTDASGLNATTLASVGLSKLAQNASHATGIVTANNLNTYTVPNMYKWAGQNPTNAPAGVTYGLMLVDHDGAQPVQLVIDGYGGGMYVRRMTSGVWTGWTRFLTDVDKSVMTPSGIITMWSGSISAIPAGWFLCNGLNGTPDLRGRFVYGASVDADIGVIGGSADAIVVAHSHTTPNHTHSTPNHSHTASSNTTGNHSHTIYGWERTGNAAVNDGVTFGYTDTDSTATSTLTSTGGNHSHTITVNSGGGGTTGGASPSTNSSGSSGTNANLPPYMKLAYIQKA
jgi:hypothetical protein